jgi:hypothetical protein
MCQPQRKIGQSGASTVSKLLGRANTDRRIGRASRAASARTVDSTECPARMVALTRQPDRAPHAVTHAVGERMAGDRRPACEAAADRTRDSAPGQSRYGRMPYGEVDLERDDQLRPHRTFATPGIGTPPRCRSTSSTSTSRRAFTAAVNPSAVGVVDLSGTVATVRLGVSPRMWFTRGNLRFSRLARP